MYHLIRATGHAEGWSVAFYFFTFIRGILFFTVVVLIGTGWSYLKVRDPCPPQRLKVRKGLRQDVVATCSGHGPPVSQWTAKAG